MWSSLFPLLSTPFTYYFIGLPATKKMLKSYYFVGIPSISLFYWSQKTSYIISWLLCPSQQTAGRQSVIKQPNWNVRHTDSPVTREQDSVAQYKLLIGRKGQVERYSGLANEQSDNHVDGRRAEGCCELADLPAGGRIPHWTLPAMHDLTVTVGWVLAMLKCTQAVQGFFPGKMRAHGKHSKATITNRTRPAGSFSSS